MKEKTLKKTSLTFEEFINLTKSESSSNFVTSLSYLLDTINLSLRKSKKDSLSQKEILFNFFGIKGNEYGDSNIITIPIFDEIIVKNIKQIPSELLIQMVDVFFREVYNNFNVILIVVKEIIDRKDIDAEKSIASLYFKATKYYDGGHRYWAKTVQDQLIEVYFPQFETEALLILLSTKQMDFLLTQGGDSMSDLFLPAFKGVKSSPPHIVKKLERVFMNYVNYYTDLVVPYPHNTIADFLNEIKPYLSPLTLKEINLLEDHIKSVSLALASFYSKDINEIEKIILLLGKTFSYNDFGLFKSNIDSLDMSLFSFSTLESYFHFYINYLFSEKDPKWFGSGNFVSALFKKDKARSFALFKEASLIFFKKYPDQKVWRGVYDDFLSSFLLEEKCNILSKKFTEMLSFFSEITKEKKKDILSSTISNLVKIILQKEQINSSSFKQLISLLKSQKLKIKMIGWFWSSIYEIEGFKKYVQILPFISLSKREIGLFYSAYIGKMIDEEDWKLFDKSLPLFAKKKGDYFIFDDVISNGFATAVGYSILNGSLFAKNCYKRFKKIKLNSESNERVLAQLIGVAVNEKDNKTAIELIKRIPKNITWNILAYNLACYYAFRKDKNNLLKTAKRCIELGKSAQQFLDDSDFDFYVEDEDFIEAIKGENKEAEKEYNSLVKPFAKITETKKDNSEIKKKIKSDINNK